MPPCCAPEQKLCSMKRNFGIRTAWQGLGVLVRAFVIVGVRDAANQLRSDLLMAGRNLSIIRSSTTEVTAPWLLREMAPRIASTLNYFLLHLAGDLRGFHKLLKSPPLLH